MFKYIWLLAFAVSYATPLGAIRGKSEPEFTYWLECKELSTNQKWLFRMDLVEGGRPYSRVDLWGRRMQCEFRVIREVNPVIEYNPKGPCDVQAIPTQEVECTR